MQSQVQIPVQQQLQPQVQIPVQQQVQMIPAQRAPMAPMASMTFQAPLGGSFTAAPIAPMMPQMAGLPSGVSFVAQNIDSGCSVHLFQVARRSRQQVLSLD